MPQYPATMGYTLSYLMAAASAFGLWYGGVWAWAGAVLVILINVCLDEWINIRPIKSALWRNVILNHKIGHAVLYFYPVVLTAYLVFGLWCLHSLPMGAAWVGGFISMCAIIGTTASNAAHEMIHRKNIFLRGMGVYTLALINHCVYRISHVEIHHHYMGTELDPSTAKPGATAMQFLRDCYFGNLQKSFRFEKGRVGLWSYRNRFWHYGLMMLVMGSLLGSLIGASAVVEWLVISVVSIQMLTMIDYVEHRSVPLRAQLADGSYEPIRGLNCSDCYHLISNLVYLNVGHHADHHCREHIAFTHRFPDSGADIMRHGYSWTVLRASFGLDMPTAPGAALVSDDEDVITAAKKRKASKAPVYIETIRRLSLERS